jgi:hypothetical protein
MTTRRDIEQQILALIETSIEDTVVPDAIAAHADKRAGKPVTKTDAEQLEAQLGVPVRISRRYGRTHVSWAIGTGRNPWLDQREILLAPSDTGVRWPSGAELRKKEHAHFAARDERNEARRALLREHAGLRDAIGGEVPQTEDESAVYRAACAIIKLREAREELLKLIDYGQPLHVIRTDVEKLAKAE